MNDRDLKGPNIFITRRLVDGGGTKEYASQNIVAKLGDFGLSAVLCGPYQVLFFLSFKKKKEKKRKRKKK